MDIVSKIVVAASSLMLASGCSYTMDEPLPATPDNPPSMTLGDSYLSDFYEVDGAITASADQLLRQEPLNERQSNPGVATNLRLLYSSTDGLGGEDRLAVSGVLFMPAGEAPEGGWP